MQRPGESLIQGPSDGTIQPLVNPSMRTLYPPFSPRRQSPVIRPDASQDVSFVTFGPSLQAAAKALPQASFL